MTVSIIIAAKTYGKNLEECISECLRLNYPDFEIIVALDESINIQYSQVKIIPTGSVSPAKKRDLASINAKGEILAFIDDDAYPDRDWLKNAVKNFEDSQIGAVGGPAITPFCDNLLSRASGKIYESILMGGPYRYRYVRGKKREVADYPSCNLLVRREVFNQLGGFSTEFWPGEDTKLCLEIVKKLNKKIIYEPQAIVYHHRRPLFIPHLRQIASYALHRGYFSKKYPQTSFKFFYFLPSIFTIMVFLGLILSIFYPFMEKLFIFSALFYFSIVFVFSINKDIRMIPFVFLGIFLSHLTYGIFFLKGLFSTKLKEERKIG